MTAAARPGPPVVRANTSEVYLRATKVLKNGQWQDLEKIIHECGKVIQPGPAARYAEHLRKMKAIREGFPDPENRKQPHSLDRLVTIGKRRMVMHTLNNKRRFEMRRDHNGRRQIRMK